MLHNERYRREEARSQNSSVRFHPRAHVWLQPAACGKIHGDFAASFHVHSPKRSRRLKQKPEVGLDLPFTDDQVDVHQPHSAHNNSTELTRLDLAPGKKGKGKSALSAGVPDPRKRLRCGLARQVGGTLPPFSVKLRQLSLLGQMCRPDACVPFSLPSLSCSNLRRPRACTGGLHQVSLPQTPEVASVTAR